MPFSHTEIIDLLLLLQNMLHDTINTCACTLPDTNNFWELVSTILLLMRKDSNWISMIIPNNLPTYMYMQLVRVIRR